MESPPPASGKSFDPAASSTDAIVVLVVFCALVRYEQLFVRGVTGGARDITKIEWRNW